MLRRCAIYANVCSFKISSEVVQIKALFAPSFPSSGIRRADIACGANFYARSASGKRHYAFEVSILRRFYQPISWSPKTNAISRSIGIYCCQRARCRMIRRILMAPVVYRSRSETFNNNAPRCTTWDYITM